MNLKALPASYSLRLKINANMDAHTITFTSVLALWTYIPASGLDKNVHKTKDLKHVLNL